VGYIDDILILGKEKDEIQEITVEIMQDLIKLGWKIKEEKCIIDPIQKIKFLVISIDLKNGWHQILQQNIQNLNTRINAILEIYPKNIPIKMLTSIKGKVIVMSIVEKQLKRLCHPIDQQISITLLRKEKGWNSKLRINKQIINLLNQIKKMIIQDPKREFYLLREIVTISIDACLTGYGGFVEGGRIVAGNG
jgi:hypothetical protein